MKRKMILTFGKGPQTVKEKRGESKGVKGTETSPGEGRLCHCPLCVWPSWAGGFTPEPVWVRGVVFTPPGQGFPHTPNPPPAPLVGGWGCKPGLSKWVWGLGPPPARADFQDSLGLGFLVDSFSSLSLVSFSLGLRSLGKSPPFPDLKVP